MILAVQILTSLSLLAVVPILYRGGSAIRQSTLTVAWGWATGKMLAWLVTWTLSVLTPVVGAASADHLWYTVSVLMLCPPVAVLGARRPVFQIWSGFVLLPLTLVFGWPMLASWSADGGFSPLEIETPIVVGYLFVLLMGAGNYFGTRFTAPAALYCLAAVILLGPVIAHPPGWLPADNSCRALASLMIFAAALVAWRQARFRVAARSGFDRVWLDFRDWFGIVWAKRVQNRLNEAAHNRKWPLRLETDGFAPMQNGGRLVTDSQTGDEIEHTLRWLLRRFVDPGWIDERLNDGADNLPPAKVGLDRPT